MINKKVALPLVEIQSLQVNNKWESDLPDK